MVRKNLKRLTFDYPYIRYAVVLAYMPDEKNKQDSQSYSDTIYPDGLEDTPLKYAIAKRNRWMINRSDYVVTYIIHPQGGAAQFKELAEKKGKYVINLVNQEK